MPRAWTILLYILMLFGYSREAYCASLSVSTLKQNYFRYEFIEFRAELSGLTKQLTNAEVAVRVFHNNRLVISVGDLKSVNLHYNNLTKKWHGKWPPPWNPPIGTYTAIAEAVIPGKKKILTSETSFMIYSKKINVPQDLLCVATLEDINNFTNKEVTGPDNNPGKWTNILSWAKYINSDAIWCLAGESKLNKSTNTNILWDPVKLKNVSRLARRAHDMQIRAGAWIMCYFSQEKELDSLGYRSSKGYSEEEGLYDTYFISLGDKKRYNDIIELVKVLEKDPYIDFIGLDYIRCGNTDGFEMAEEVAYDMDIPLNGETREERIKEFYSLVSTNENILDRWRWWKSNKTARIVDGIIRESGMKKPLWVFTLGWEQGHHHGQDPYMMMDAGVAMDAVMLYESTWLQYNYMMSSWKQYMVLNSGRLMVGDSIIEKNLYYNENIPPEEYYRRLTYPCSAIPGVHGMFLHDLSRALYKNSTKYPSQEWLLAGASAFSYLRWHHREIPYSVRILSITRGRAEIEVLNHSIQSINEIKINFIETDGTLFKPEDHSAVLKDLGPGETRKFSVEFKFILHQRIKHMFALRASCIGYRDFFTFQYF